MLALFGDQHGIAQCERDDVHAELDASRSAGDGCQRRHALENRCAADDAVRLPNRVGAARLAQIDPPPEARGRVERIIHEAKADGDGHERRPLLTGTHRSWQAATRLPTAAIDGQYPFALSTTLRSGLPPSKSRI